MRSLRWFGFLLTALVLTACVSSAGRLVLSHSAAHNAEVDIAHENSAEPVFLLPRQADFDAWFEGLPPTLQDDLRIPAERVDLSSSVAVVGFYGQCMEESRVVSPGAGEVALQVYVPLSKRNIACESSPIRLVVYQVPLTALRVTDPDDVRLVDE